ENETFVYGSLYLLQYARNPEAFKRAIDMSLKTTQGVMLFDLVYLRDYNWWDALKQVFPTPAKAPHSVPGLLDKIHEVKKLIEEDGKS
ncbi:MAG TPA: alpha amylase family protein, partial [Armatimonadota bacterium]|nr:alpha amylase family protein [Armatimonadota bacterium]